MRARVSLRVCFSSFELSDCVMRWRAALLSIVND